MADKTATYSLKVDSNAKQAGDEGAAALEKLKASVGGSLAQIKDYNTSLRSLRGSTDDVKKAREELKGKLDAEKAAMSAVTLEMLKQGTSYEKLAGEAKAAADQVKKHEENQKKQAEEIRKANEPLQEITGRYDKLQRLLGSNAGQLVLLVGAFAAVGAAIVEVDRKVIELSVSFARWMVEAADFARSQNLQRQAWTGSAENAEHLGHQIDALARKVPLTRDKLQEMSGTLVKALNNSRVSGQGIVDTFNAVAQASAAMGDETANKLREIIERGKNIGRGGIGQFELQGQGVSRDDIAKRLAANMKIGVKDAILALSTGYVQIDQLAKATREAVEGNFGKINAQRLLGLDFQIQRFREHLDKLASQVNLEPLLKALDQIGNLFDETTITGAALKQIVTALGNALSQDLGGSAPSIEHVFKVLVLGALKATIALLEFRKWVKDHTEAVKVFFVSMGATISAAFAPLLGVATTIKATFDILLNTDWKKVGRSIIDGLVAGLRAGWGVVKDTVGDIAQDIKSTFTGVLQIQSPSAVFKEYGKQTTRGYEQGLDEGRAPVQQAVNRMAPEKPAEGGAAPAPAGTGRAPAMVSIPITIHASGEGAAAQLAEPQFLAALTRAIQDALVSAGLPVHAGPQ